MAIAIRHAPISFLTPPSLLAVAAGRKFTARAPERARAAAGP
jgi:hypothetical protein